MEVTFNNLSIEKIEKLFSYMDNNTYENITDVYLKAKDAYREQVSDNADYQFSYKELVLCAEIADEFIKERGLVFEK